MLRISIIFLLTIFISPVKLNAQAWAQLPGFPAAERDDGVAFVINGKAYVGTGLKVGWSLGNDFYVFDLGMETWSIVASLPAGQERQYACGFTDGTNGYVFGGEAGGNDLNTLWMYSPATNSWTAKTSKPGNGVRGASCFVIGNIAYIIGGAVGTTDAINEVWAYDMGNNTWIQKNNLPFTCWRGCSVSEGGNGYLLFGRESNGRFRKELFRFDPLGDSWSLISTFPLAGRTYATMHNINVSANRLIIFGGLDTLGNYYNDAWAYSLVPGNWTQLTSLPSFGRKGGMGFSNGVNLYYSCGIDQNDTRLKETWKASFPDAVEEFTHSKTFKIYPNPANEILFIEGLVSPEIFKISDLSGRTVSEGVTDGSINVTGLVSGLYILNMNGFSAKIIIR